MENGELRENMQKSSIAVLGAGSWGTALSLLLHNKGHDVRLWMRSIDQYDALMKTRENKGYLSGIHLPKELKIFNEIEKAIENTNIILLAIPTQSVRNILNILEPYIKPNQIIVNASKGLELNSYLRVSQITKEILPRNAFVALSGPSHAEEVCKRIPTTIVVSGEDRESTEYVQDVFMTREFRVYINPDLIGVELGGALKNIIAFGAGVSDGLGYGDNAKAALMTRGLSEMSRLGKAMGANLSTFAGLTGIGDLIVTCTSMHSRNRRAGILVGQGKSLEEAIKEIEMVVEGITTTKAAYELSKKYGVEMPITEEIYKILYANDNAKDAVTRLMTRSKKHEMEENVDIPFSISLIEQNKI